MKGAIMTSDGGTKLFAAIGVTYPAGSTLTCTNGSKTLTAKTTTGQWVFAIPEAGTWTVTATDGTNSKSQSVSITTEGQFESVTLSYRLNLYTNGVENVTWNYVNGVAGVTRISKDEDKFCIYTTEAITSETPQIYTATTINLSGYNTVNIKGSSLKSGTLYFCVCSTNPTADPLGDEALAKLTIGEGSGDFEKALDISEISGDLYVNIGCYVYYPALGDHYYIREIWAE